MAAIDKTGEDDKLVKDYLLHLISMETLELDITKVKTSSQKMRDVYSRLLRKHQLQIEKELYDVRKQMKERGIKIYEETRNENTVDAKFLCRGYHHKISMLWSTVRSEIEVRLCDRFGISMADPE